MPPSKKSRRLEITAYLEMSRIHRVMERRVAQLFHEQGISQVTPAQANALTILLQSKEPMTARALAGEMSLSEVTVGRFVRALEAAGWVSRHSDPADSRARLIRPTDKAFAALPRLMEVSNALLDEAFGAFSEDEIETIAETVAQIREAIEHD